MGVLDTVDRYRDHKASGTFLPQLAGSAPKFQFTDEFRDQMELLSDP